jgi:signal transduction histidine kinase
MNNYSHDLMNSLYTIKGMAEVHLERLKDGFEPNPIPETLDIMERVRRKSSEALSIVRRLQNPSLQVKERGLKSRNHLPDQKVSVKRAFFETQRLIEKEGCAQDLEFLNRIPKDFPLVLCRRSQFRELLYHLMKNSLDAMEETSFPKRMVIRASLTHLEGALKAKIALSDTGSGVPETVLTSLAQPFFTTKREGRGNGLGLYLAKRLTEENGGSLAIESFPGSGTTVTLTFPLASAV